MKLHVLVAIIAISGCKKDDNKPATASASGTASATAAASASGTGTASASASAAPKPPPASMAGFATIAKSEARAANGMAAGAGGGIGGALGGMFGAAGAADTAAPTNPAAPAQDVDPGDDDPTPSGGDGDDYDMSKIVFPPAGAKGGDCAAVAERIILMVGPMLEQQIKTMPAEQQEMAHKMMGDTVRDSMMKTCTEEKWPAELRDCVLTAMDQAALEKCNDLSKAAHGGGDAEPAQKPAPAWTGGHECADVGARMVELVVAQVPADQKDEMKKQLDDGVKELTDECTSSGWTEAQRTCMVQAPTVDEAGNCLSSP